MTRMLRPVSCASCSRMCRVGFGVATNAAFRVSSCLALMVVRGPRRFVLEFCSSFSLLLVSLSEDVELSVSFVSSWIASGRSGDKLRSVHDDTEVWWRTNEEHIRLIAKYFLLFTVLYDHHPLEMGLRIDALSNNINVHRHIFIT